MRPTGRHRARPARQQLQQVRASAEQDARKNVKLGTQGSDTAQLMKLPSLTGHITPFTGRLAGLFVGGPLMELMGVPHGALVGEGVGYGLGQALEAPLQSANRDIVRRMGQTFTNPREAAQVLSRAHAPPGKFQALTQYLLPYESRPRVLHP